MERASLDRPSELGNINLTGNVVKARLDLNYDKQIVVKKSESRVNSIGNLA